MTQAQKGTFLQLPSVFIETCDLPETAQIMYIRMLHNFGYKGVYTGSLRKLAHLVRMSKSTVDRMLDVLADGGLIGRGMSDETDTLHTGLLYIWIKDIYSENASPDSETHLQKQTDEKEYFIYKLYEDNEDNIHYIGITKDLDRRYHEHCQCSGTNLNLNLWIQNQLHLGKSPRMGLLDVTRGYTNALKLETRYISHYWEIGMPLKNSVVIGGAR